MLGLLFCDQTGDHLYETRLNMSQCMCRDENGVVRMTIDVEYPEELKWWIFGFGAKVAVLAPASLRDKLGADLDAAVLRYR
ncbi:MAG: WYL domain-containing protein [Thalassolituus sp.]